MKYWNELSGADLFNTIFKDNIDISSITPYNISVDVEKKNITISFDLEEHKHSDEFRQRLRNNICRCTLVCNQVTSVNLHGTPINSISKIKIYNKKDHFKIFVSGDEFYVDFVCARINLMEPSLYSKCN